MPEQSWSWLKLRIESRGAYTHGVRRRRPLPARETQSKYEDNYAKNSQSKIFTYLRLIQPTEPGIEPNEDGTPPGEVVIEYDCSVVFAATFYIYFNGTQLLLY